jgi:hypothetical protein
MMTLLLSMVVVWEGGELAVGSVGVHANKQCTLDSVRRVAAVMMPNKRIWMCRQFALEGGVVRGSMHTGQ